MSHFYVFVRSDIPVADQGCQIAHACIGIATDAPGKFRSDCDIDDCQNLVLLKVANLEDLEQVEATLAQHGIESFTHSEPDDNLGKCAVATAPIESDSKLRAVFRRQRLWNPEIA